MSSAQFVVPKIRLGRILKQRGGTTVMSALAAAERNLGGLKGKCLEELAARTAAVEQVFDQVQSGDVSLTELYRVTNSIVGLGAPAGLPYVDQAVMSLCDLLDPMLMAPALFDRRKIQIHVGALRLLQSSGMQDQSARLLMVALAKLRAHGEPSARAPQEPLDI